MKRQLLDWMSRPIRRFLHGRCVAGWMWREVAPCPVQFDISAGDQLSRRCSSVRRTVRRWWSCRTRKWTRVSPADPCRSRCTSTRRPILNGPSLWWLEPWKSRTTTSSPECKKTSCYQNVVSLIERAMANLCPERRMDNVKGFQVFLVLILEDVVNFAHPRHRWVVVPLSECVEVKNDIVSFD